MLFPLPALMVLAPLPPVMYSLAELPVWLPLSVVVISTVVYEALSVTTVDVDAVKPPLTSVAVTWTVRLVAFVV